MLMVFRENVVRYKQESVIASEKARCDDLLVIIIIIIWTVQTVHCISQSPIGAFVPRTPQVLGDRCTAIQVTRDACTALIKEWLQ